MEAWRRVEFNGVELAGGAKLAAPVEKAAAGEKHSVEGGRPTAVLGHGGDVGQQSTGTMEREARWRGKARWRAPLPRRHAGELSRRAVVALL